MRLTWGFLFVLWCGFNVSVYAVPQPIYMGDRSDPIVALTFDDGPHPDYTYDLLHILETYQVPSTFFVVGNSVKNYSQLIRDIVSSGHELANHSFTHQRMDALRLDDIRVEIEATTEVIERVSGQPVRYFRPPGGRYNRHVLDVVEEAGLIMVLWDVNAADYYHKKEGGHGSLYPFRQTVYQRPASSIVRDVLKKVKNGSIVLFHNIDGETLKALPPLIEALQQKGYRLVRLQEMLK